MFAQLLWTSPGARRDSQGRICTCNGVEQPVGVTCPGGRCRQGGMGATLRLRGLHRRQPRRWGVLPGPPPSDTLGFLQTKALIDKLQKLVSSEGRFKNLREALKK